MAETTQPVLMLSARSAAEAVLALVFMNKHAWRNCRRLPQQRASAREFMRGLAAAGLPPLAVEELTRGAVVEGDALLTAVEFCNQCRQPSADVPAAAARAAAGGDMGTGASERHQAAPAPNFDTNCVANLWSRLGERMAETHATAVQVDADPATLVQATLRAASDAWEGERSALDLRPGPAPRAGADRQPSCPLTADTSARLVTASTWPTTWSWAGRQSSR
jgi:hypothetical protein